MKTNLKTGGILSLLVIKLSIIVVILLIAGFINLRLDLSKGRVYSISKSSKEAVHGLKDRMVIKIYASEELPPNFLAVRRYLNDLLAEYKNYGGSKFSYEFVKTASSDELNSIASQHGFMGFNTQSMENDRITFKNTVFSLTMEYNGKQEILDLPPGIESRLEYSLTNRVRRLAGQKLPELIVFRDSTYASYPTDMLERSLDENYFLGSTDLFTPVRKSPTLLFTGVIDSMATEQLYNLDQYLMNGGKVVFLQDRISLSETAPYNIESNIFELLESYGIVLGRDMILDLQSAKQPGTLGQPGSAVPFIPIVRGSTKNVITKNMKDIMILFGSEIGIMDSTSLSYEPILSTSANSALIPGPAFDVDPQMLKMPDPAFYAHPPVTIGALIKGKLRSHFADDPLYSARPGFKAATDNAELVIYGDRELIMDSKEAEFNNRNFIVLNAIDYLQDNLAMIGIRSRSIQESYLDIYDFMYRKNLMWGKPEQTEKRIKTAVKVVSIAVPPLLLIAFGLILIKLNKNKTRGIV
ncbi:MAG TPA: Gldg family protein [Candidatus Cloacimonadota bacterium]|nr:Gldg family protein [Candidatus Cloacimonadota bacterium]